MNDGAIAIARAENHGVEIISLEGDLDLTNANLVREAVEATSSGTVSYGVAMPRAWAITIKHNFN